MTNVFNVPDELYADAKAGVKWLKSYYHRPALYRVYKNGRRYADKDYVCYGGLYPMGSGISHIVVYITNHDVLGAKDLRAYLDMLFNHTHFKQLLWETDVDKVLEDGFFIVNPHFHNAYVMQFLIATRLYRENPACAEKVVRLFEEGVDPYLALFVGCLCTEVNKQIMLINITHDHYAVDSEWDRDIFNNWVKVNPPIRSLMSEDTCYRGVWAQYGKKTGESLKSIVNQFIVMTGIRKGFKSSYVHPFKNLSTLSKTNDPPKMERQDFFKLIAEHQHEIMGG